MRLIRLIRALSLTIAGGMFLLGVALGQSSPQQTPLEFVLTQRLQAEISANIQASAMIIELQRHLAAVQGRLKALEDKYEPKKQEPAPAK